ncbi:putative serine/threonine-protein kinase [Forsythia ovata]|uniref:Serine/threonine-protein kinase n=1 Tax=Forsythia ovata TaxID=205694 RepID=A0ABD1XDB6_9LAMI
MPLSNFLGEQKELKLSANTPFYDDDGSLVGLVCVSSDARPFLEPRAVIFEPKPLETDSRFSRHRSFASAKLGLDPQQPLQAAISSKISNFASKVSNKVKSKIRSEENGSDRDIGSGDSHHSDHGFSDAALSEHREDAASSGASTPKGDTNPSPFGVFSGVSHEENSPVNPSRDSGDESEGKPGMSKIITSKAEAWIGKKGLSWPWKGNERDGSETKTSHLVWPWLQNDQENELGEQKSASAILKSENQVSETNRTANSEASGSWSSPFNVNSTSTASSGGSTSSTAVNKIDMVSDCLDYEILWEDLTIGEQIGQGKCIPSFQFASGYCRVLVELYLWYGSDVAVKVFSRQEYSDDVIFSFRQEVLYRFLEFFSNFDWDNFCVSLWGPVPISSLPDVTAEPPRKDSGELLFSKLFLDACSSVYVVFPGGHENNGQPFVSKHFNVIDPLRVNNNLGRSVSKVVSEPRKKEKPKIEPDLFVFFSLRSRLSGVWPCLCLVSASTSLPNELSGQYFGLFSGSTTPTVALVLAIEFDTGRNSEFNDPEENHVRIDLKNIVSVITQTSSYYSASGVGSGVWTKAITDGSGEGGGRSVD